MTTRQIIVAVTAAPLKANIYNNNLNAHDVKYQ